MDSFYTDEMCIPPLGKWEDYPRACELRRQLRRWMNIQGQMHKFSTRPFYHRNMDVIDSQLNRLEKEMSDIGWSMTYREGERTRTRLFHEGTPEYLEMVRRNFQRLKQPQIYKYPVGPSLKWGYKWHQLKSMCSSNFCAKYRFSIPTAKITAQCCRILTMNLLSSGLDNNFVVIIFKTCVQCMCTHRTIIFFFKRTFNKKAPGVHPGASR